MLICRLILIAIATAAFLQPAAAQDKKETTPTTKRKADVPIFDVQQEPSSLTKLKESRMSVAELRQSRALRKADQRRARMERNAWLGYQPLRPTFNTVPMMRSRYETRTIVIPVYTYR